MSKRSLLSTVAAFILLQSVAVLAYFYVEHSRQGDDEPSFHVERLSGTPALPAIELMRADGSVVRSADLLHRPVLLHFWATWCVPCRDELPELLRFGSEAGLQVVALTVDDNWGIVRQFFGETVPSEIVRDASGTLAKTYEVSALPDSYLIDHNGLPQLRFGGTRDWHSAGARDVLAPYLGR